MPNEASRRPTGRSFRFLIACLLALPSRSAFAQQIDGAEAESEVTIAEQKAAQAFDAYRGKRYAEAVALYIAAYDSAPNADILYNIARIYDTKLGDRPLAINFYRRYIADPGAVPERIQVANERLLALRDAELAAARPVDPQSAEQPATTLQVVSVRSAPAPEARWTGAEVAGAVMSTVGLAAIGVGAGFGLAAMDQTRTVRDLCEGNVCSEQRGIDAAESANDHALISTIGFASGGALLALGAAFYFWPDADSSERGEVADAGLELGAQLSAGRDGWGLELGGTW